MCLLSLDFLKQLFSRLISVNYGWSIKVGYAVSVSEVLSDN